MTSDLNGVNCVNRRHLTVVVVPEFGFTAVDLTNTTCFGYDDGEIAVEPWGQPGPPWTYELYENGILEQSETTNGNGTLEILTAGTYEVRLIEPFGCMHDTTVVITHPSPRDNHERHHRLPEHHGHGSARNHRRHRPFYFLVGPRTGRQRTASGRSLEPHQLHGLRHGQ
ncbi:MAG: hypothetical protein IPI07_04090 [Flavobacteriales bacterium]|nr:hypothetical protein [Flavobacteriales bacterium]